jgi:homoserine O-acetyltransferase
MVQAQYRLLTEGLGVRHLRLMRRMLTDAIRWDPGWHGGDYDE